MPAAGLASTSSPSSSPSPLPHHSWPCPRLRRAWLTVLRLLQRVCHRALTLTLGRPVLGAPPPSASGRQVAAVAAAAAAAAAGREPGKQQCPVCRSGLRVRGELEEQGAAVAESMGGAGGGPAGGDVRDSGGGGGCGARKGVSDQERRPGRFSCSDADVGRGPSGDSGGGGSGGGGGGGGGGSGGGSDEGDDFSVSYALHYPNEFADPALEDKDLTVGEHVDPSLFVAEPCCGVEGLEIRDRSSGRYGSSITLRTWEVQTKRTWGWQRADEAPGKSICCAGSSCDKQAQGKDGGVPSLTVRGPSYRTRPYRRRLWWHFLLLTCAISYQFVRRKGARSPVAHI